MMENPILNCGCKLSLCEENEYYECETCLCRKCSSCVQLIYPDRKYCEELCKEYLSSQTERVPSGEDKPVNATTASLISVGPVTSLTPGAFSMSSYIGVISVLLIALFLIILIFAAIFIVFFKCRRVKTQTSVVMKRENASNTANKYESSTETRATNKASITKNENEEEEKQPETGELHEKGIQNGSECVAEGTSSSSNSAKSSGYSLTQSTQGQKRTGSGKSLTGTNEHSKASGRESTDTEAGGSPVISASKKLTSSTCALSESHPALQQSDLLNKECLMESRQGRQTPLLRDDNPSLSSGGHQKDTRPDSGLPACPSSGHQKDTRLFSVATATDCNVKLRGEVGAAQALSEVIDERAPQDKEETTFDDSITCIKAVYGASEETSPLLAQTDRQTCGETVSDPPVYSITGGPPLNTHTGRNNKSLYPILRGLPWLIGYMSQGQSIEVFVEFDEISPEEALVQLVRETGERPEKFHVKQNQFFP